MSMDPIVERGIVQLPRPRAEIIRSLDYDPDRDAYVAEEPHPVTINLDDEKTEVWARLFELNRYRRRYRQMVYPTKERLFARYTSLGTRLKEAGYEPDDLFAMGYDAVATTDPDRAAMGGWVNNEYLPMMVGPFSRQLYLYDYLDMHRKAFEAVNHNPLARAIISITSMFVIGKGVTATSKHEKTLAIWNKFSRENDLPQRLRVWCDELSLYGELMLWFKVNRVLNSIKVRSVDPATVWEIVTEPDDIEFVYYYHQQYPTQYQMYGMKNIPLTRYIIRQIPGPEVLHTKVNVTSGEKRGRSDLYPILGWLKRVKDYYTAQVVRAQMLSSYVYDDTIRGSPTDVATHVAWVKANPPQPGDVFAHNEAVMREIKSSQGRVGDISSEGEALLNLVGVGVQVPKEYLGISVSGSRATALVATEPAAKRFEDRQYVIESILHRVADKLFDITRVPESERDIEFTFPSIATEDRSIKLNDLAHMESMAWISHQTAATIGAKELQITNYDFEKEMQLVGKELGGKDPRTLIAAKFAMVAKIAETPMGGPGGGFPGDGKQEAGGSPRPPAQQNGQPGEKGLGQELVDRIRGREEGVLGQGVRGRGGENNPLAQRGRQELRRELSQQEADEGKAEAPHAHSHGGATKTTMTMLKEQKPSNFRPGYRTPHGKDVEAIIGAAQEKLRDTFRKAFLVFGEALDEPLGQSELIEFTRQFEFNALDALLPLASQAYATGIEKAVTQIQRDKSTPEQHAAILDTWFTLVRERIGRATNEMEEWLEREWVEKKQAPTVGSLMSRFLEKVAAIGLGLWTLYQLGFQEAVVGGAVRDEKVAAPEELPPGVPVPPTETAAPVLFNYIAVGDENTCDPCLDAAAGSPYPAHLVPMPGEVCLGRERCRCEVEVA